MSTIDPRTVRTPEQRSGRQAAEDHEIRELADSLHGELLQPGDSGYDEARSIWNGMIDRRPGLIARCADAVDISRGIDFARTHGLVLAVRGGDHNVAGNAVSDGGLMLDLSLLKGITVDPTTRTARVDAGVRWAELDAETQRHGLAVTGGMVSDTGVAGLTLGGGFGWLGVRYGLTSDNLIAADVVTADGRLLRASETENPDLFWGLRGGSGNFGVVSSFTFRLHPVGPEIVAGMVAHPLDKAPEVLDFYREFISSASDDVSTDVAFLRTPDGMPIVAIAACYLGSPEDGERALAPLKEFGPPILDQIGLVPYAGFQQAFDAAFPRGRRYYWKSHVVPAIPPEMVDLAVEHFSAAPSPHSILLFQGIGKAANEVPPETTAFPHRQARWDAVVLCGWDDPAHDDENIAWARGLYEAWQPFGIGTYVNVVPDGTTTDLVAAAYGARHERLSELKAKYDPTNLFRMNVNIAPKPVSG